MAGFGCCGGSNNFRGPNAGINPPKFGSTITPPGADTDGAPVCDIIAMGPTYDLSYGGGTGPDQPAGTPGGWPKWVAPNGCGTISILKLQEKSFPKKLGGKKVLTPENAKWMADCMCLCAGGDLDCKGGARDGILGPKDEECRVKCKKRLMSRFYEMGVDPSSYKTSAAYEYDPYLPPSETVVFSGPYCPPLCVGQEVIIGYSWEYKCWIQGPFNVWRVHGTAFGSHSIQCKIISCSPNIPGLSMCFECEDHPPQVPRKTTICMDDTGLMTHRDIGATKWGPARGIGQPGSCIKKMQNPKYHGGDTGMNPDTKHFRSNQCCEIVYNRHTMVKTIITETPCPDDDITNV